MLICKFQQGTLMLLHADRSVLGRQETAAWVACGGVAFCLAYTLVFVPESLSRPAQLLVSPPADSHSWYYLTRTVRYPKAGTLLLLLCTFGCAHAQQPGAGAWSSCAAIRVYHLAQVHCHEHWQALGRPDVALNP